MLEGLSGRGEDRAAVSHGDDIRFRLLGVAPDLVGERRLEAIGVRQELECDGAQGGKSPPRGEHLLHGFRLQPEQRDIGREQQGTSAGGDNHTSEPCALAQTAGQAGADGCCSENAPGRRRSDK